MYPPDQHNVHPFLPVFLDILTLSLTEERNSDSARASEGGYDIIPATEGKFLSQLLFGHIFNKEVI